MSRLAWPLRRKSVEVVRQLSIVVRLLLTIDRQSRPLELPSRLVLARRLPPLPLHQVPLILPPPLHLAPRMVPRRRPRRRALAALALPPARPPPATLQLASYPSPSMASLVLSLPLWVSSLVLPSCFERVCGIGVFLALQK